VSIGCERDTARTPPNAARTHVSAALYELKNEGKMRALAK